MEASSAWFAGRTWCFKEAVYNPGNSPRLFLCWLILVWFIALLGLSNQRRDTSENKITRSSYSHPRKYFLNLIIWDLRASASHSSFFDFRSFTLCAGIYQKLKSEKWFASFFWSVPSIRRTCAMLQPHDPQDWKQPDSDQSEVRCALRWVTDGKIDCQCCGIQYHVITRNNHVMVR